MSNHHESSEGAKLAGQTPPMSLQAQANAIVHQLNELIEDVAFINITPKLCVDLQRARDLIVDAGVALRSALPDHHTPKHHDIASLERNAVENLCNAFNGGFTAWQDQRPQREMVATAVRQIVEAARHV